MTVNLSLTMFGKHFASMYSGSMVGCGAINFAVMGYVVANAKPDKEVGMQVELNPVLLAAILGEALPKVEEAIRFLCSPDENSRSKAEDGKRLVRLGQFDYRVVNGMKYRDIRDEESRRKQNRVAQALSRARKKGLPLKGEQEYVQALNDGNEGLAEKVLEKFLPK